MNVVVRTHGGLGNQIFQLLYARLFAATHKATLFELHDLRYKHAFGRSAELPCAPPAAGLPNFLSGLRLPKIASRLGVRCDAVSLFGTTYLDGYFQRVEDYAQFAPALLAQELDRLRVELRVVPAPGQGTGVHLRLGDFFTSDVAVVAHLDERMARIGVGASIVTNDEKRLATPSIAAALAALDARVVSTANATPEEVLRTLANFAYVDGNDSTLLFWASVLSGMDCEYRNAELSALRLHFLAALANRSTAA